MAKIITASTHIKENEIFKVTLRKDQSDKNLIGKKCSIHVTKVSNCRLYENDYYFQSYCQEKFGVPVVEFNFNLGEGIYAIAGFSNCIEGETYVNSIYERNMHIFQVYSNMKIKISELSQLGKKLLMTFII